ncbi:B-family DNA polymerase [Acanthamoeba castellanii mimivirus]|uniref:DNA polymerase n=25 Tax=Mimiviridae TaxID=549779 RepID=DPOL_MIMIV|nr:DNA polymerase [Acanthamoeba polyphaga mimivirus]Q5UQR0.1 RecName: Full=DNA polymerase; Contains: RecName: Full=Mimv polB intein [Acanthamoeba polyphaga mimivirus]AEQ60511.1 DNA polymerase type B [Acanthamoeba castellanii mamavirus]AEY99268.1 DNA polymerase B [Mimivirus marais]AFM52354.1 B-family DNA polymerase [Mimivirus fauteuil]AFM52355.1 B-family DNA polymerase [Mimivirus longchamps]AFM52357.1 B-family DNA polymerase [Mamavirus AC-2012]AFM52365.1 B-family DNA polymerase [Mimivirus len
MPSETIDSTKQFEFQISDWNSYHELDQEEEEKYVIQLFGRTEDDHDVCLKVTGYTPFFYVEIPKQWKQRQVDKFVEILKNKVQYHCKKNLDEDFDLSKSLIKYAMVKKHKFYNFRNKQLYNFLLLVFKSHTAMKEFSSILARPLEAKGLTNKPMLYQRYESNIEPHIRFMHINNLSSCGWASIDKDKLKKIPEYSNCDYSFSVNWKDVKPSNNDDRMAPFKIMGYDIECVSCDQNFPQAERPSDKIIQIGITMYRYGSMKCYEQHILTLKKCAPIEGVNVECYKKEKGLLRGFAKKIAELRPDFKTGYNNFGFDDKYIYDRILRIDKREGKKQGVNINALKNKFMDEILRTIGKVNNNYLIENEGLDRIPIYTTVKDKKISSKASRFIQIRGGTYVENGNNLKYVQSPGITYFEVKNLSSSALGDNELKFIQIPGVLSIDMMKVIQRDHRLIGYKLDNVSANFITEKADKIIEMPHNQEDSDSEKEDEDTDDKTYDVNIYTKSTKALEKDSYIQIMVNDGYSSSPLSEGAKYKVYDIQTITEKKLNEKTNKEEIFVYQAIKTKICQKDIQQLRETIKNPLLGISWTFAKDDMHHTKINEYFEEGDPKKIRQIAKYCLKDCKLVNLLLAKLEIIVNSVGMAKVCHVPLSYLFLRGQGVKIFSLVSKKCREKNFLIPVLRRKSKDNEGDEDETYEGATVITPKPNVYLSPIGVLDYSSLYPNSMRERNLSQECYVDDSKYDNLPGYIYHDVEIILKDKKGKILRNIDGTPQKEYHRFAQEIITDEQINRELKDIFDKINTVFENNVAIIQNQKYFTEKNISELIDKHKNISDSKIEDIEFDESLSDKRKNKLVDAEKDSLDKNIGFYQKIKSQIDKIKLDSKIEIDNLSKNLNEEEKSKQINKMELNTKNLISKVFSKYLITEQQREELIVLEKERAKRSVNAEKAKVYNTVDGITVRYGILPEILTELLNKRKETNGKLANEKDPFVKAILNALQLAFKVTANSLYGQTGAPTSPLYFIAIAACTTAIGRERLHYAKKTVEDNFPGSEVIYGDSVTGDTPIITRHQNGDINITTIEELGSKWKPYEIFKAHEKNSNRKFKQQSQYPTDSEVWTAKGWAKIKRVIRHKTVKKIYRVLTHTGCIDVTEDHSLLDPNQNIIKPINCQIGTELLHGFPESNNVYDNISEQEAYVWGFFMGDGSCGSYQTKNGIKYSWALNNQDLDVLNKCKKYLEETENIQFKILDTMKSSSVYKLVPIRKIKYMVNKYRKIFYDNKKYKLVPKEILNSTKDIKNSFLEGYYAADGSRKETENMGCRRCDIKGKISAQCLFYLLKSLGYNVSINIRSDKNQIYRLTFSNKKQRKNPIAIKKIQLMNETSNDHDGDYVYDLETESGSFHAGVGEMIVKNTDSIFINFHIKDENGEEKTDKEALMKTIAKCQRAAKLINQNVPKPQSIVYEKTLHPFILVAKKKYVGLLFEKSPDKYFLKSMGIVLKRRDNAPIVKIVVGGIIDNILKNRDIDKAIEYTKIVLDKLMNGEYPMDKFIISKTLKSRYKKPSTIAHKVLADRMAVRDPGNKPQINDRIPFVYIVKDMGKKKKKDILQGDLIEHPEYVIANNLKIDYLYYLEHQIINPASQILELMMDTKDVQKFFNKYIIDEQNKRKGAQSLTKWMDFSKLPKESGSKTAKKPYQSQKLQKTKSSNKSQIDPKYINLIKNKSRKHECQNMNKWISSTDKCTDDWEPIVE